MSFFVFVKQLESGISTDLTCTRTHITDDGVKNSYRLFFPSVQPRSSCLVPVCDKSFLVQKLQSAACPQGQEQDAGAKSQGV